MEWENAPAQLDPIVPLQTVGTHGTEITPGSDIVEKDLDNRHFGHDATPLEMTTET
jgi:hypothetical protein